MASGRSGWQQGYTSYDTLLCLADITCRCFSATSSFISLSLASCLSSSDIGRIERRKDRKKDGRKEGRKDRKKEGRKDGKKDGRTEGKTERQKEGRKEERTERKKEGRKEGRTIRRTGGNHFFIFPRVFRSPPAAPSCTNERNEDLSSETGYKYVCIYTYTCTHLYVYI
jgi:hypothetical protein